MDSANPQPPSQPFFASLGVKFYRFRTLFRRHWWIVALTCALGLALKGYLLFTQPRLYESESRMIIREEMIKDSDAGGFRDQTGGNFIGTTIEQLKSPTVLDRAVQRVAVEAPQFAGEETPEIKPSAAPRSGIILVSGIGAQPEYTQRYVDAVVEELKAIRLEQRTGIKTEVTGQLGDQVANLKKELESEKAKLQEFIEKNNMAFWVEQGKSAAAYLSGLKNNQANLQNELQRLENLSPDQLLTVQPAAPVAPKVGGNNPAVSSPAQQSFNSELYTQFLLKTQELTQKQAELEERSEVWKPAHPRLKELKAEVERIQRNLEVIKSQNAEAAANRIVNIKAELKSLDSSIQTWEEKSLEASRKDGEYQTLQANVARTQAQTEKLLGSVNSIMTGSTTDPDPLVVMQKASVAKEVPKGAVKHLLIGLLGGLVIGSLILFVINRLDDRLNSSSELLQQFTEPILAQIPNVIESRTDAGLPLVRDDDQRYSYAEAFRSLRSSLIFMPNQSDLRTLLVTSAIPNEGKSTIASNLAVTMAASGARVILVDADLRRGDIAQIFGLEGRAGLSSVLRGELPWKEAVVPTKYPTLSVITRGPVTNQSGELLLKPAMTKLLEELKGAYDLAIFNTAPILATDDTPSLAPNFDGALMVVRAQFTSARLTRNALDALYQRQVNVLGLILNSVDAEMPDYHYYRYPKYYAA
jgi:capsular exopolysaccharide synthesis family protein